MKNVKDFTIGKKVKWYCEGIVDKEVIIASEIITEVRIRINHINKNGTIREGGYVNINELYEI